jgi:hypothetical protein
MDEPRTSPARQLWGPDGCTLLPIVRDLIMRAHLSTTGKGYADYQAVWMPDLPPGPPTMRVGQDCTQLPESILAGRPRPTISAEWMYVKGFQFAMSTEPAAAHAVYVAVCNTCHTVFYSSVWDRTDTIEAYTRWLDGEK